MIATARTIHFASAVLLFGELLFWLVVATPVWNNASGAALQRKQRLLPLGLVCGAWTLAASVISGAIWLVAEATIMSGVPIAQAIRDNTIGLVLGRTAFGHLWLWRLGLAAALGALLVAIGRSTSERFRLRIVVGAVLV